MDDDINPGGFGTYEHRLCGAKRKYDGKPCRAPATAWSKRCRMHGGARGSGKLSEAGRTCQRAAVTRSGLYAGPNNPVIADPKSGPRWPGHRPKLSPNEREAFKAFGVPLRSYGSRRPPARDPQTGRFISWRDIVWITGIERDGGD
jgi:hypothetical protein